jgi:hypothetical protein
VRRRGAEFSEGVLKGPLEQSLFNDTMYAAPFYGTPSCSGTRKSVAKEAGLDMTQPVTWDQIIEAAEQTGTTVAVARSTQREPDGVGERPVQVGRRQASSPRERRPRPPRTSCRSSTARPAKRQRAS